MINVATLLFLAVMCLSRAHGQYWDEDHDDNYIPRRPGAHYKYGPSYQQSRQYPSPSPSHNYEEIEHEEYGNNRYHDDDYYYDYEYTYCPRLEHPENGRVKQRGKTPGSKATYLCKKGFILTGDRIRICKKNGQFSGEAPTCEPIDCGQPGEPENGNVQVEDTTLGNEATQSCNEGYNLAGVEVRTCLANGQWSDDVAQCEPVDCGQPPAPENGEVVADDGTTLGNTATQSCNEGFILQGVEERTCLPSGQWSDDVAQCEPVNCGPLDDPENGAVSFTDTTYLSLATYTCDEGYIRVGSRVRGCQSNGEWSSEAPICTPVDCGPPEPAGNNGDLSVGETTLGNTANYSCDDGFDLIGSATATCQTDGNWSSGAPVCQPVDCGPPEPAGDNGDLSVGETTLGNTATYSCDDGFDLIGSATATCQTDGTWSSGAPVCHPVECGSPDDPDDNGDVDFDSTTFGSTATYSCDEGYILTGSETVVCQADRNWSDTAPACEPVDCGPPEPAGDNGNLSVDETTLGNTANYSCDDGFDLIGSATATCQTDGTWSSGAPVCHPVDCGSPDDPDDNGDVDVDSTTFGSTATYSCDEGYILTGSETVVCQADRSWSDSAPACVPVDCGSLSDPENGNVVTEPDTTLGSVATYSCKRGFKLVGNEQRDCQTNGAWSGDQPSCEKIRCPKLKPPKYGKIYLSGYYPGDHVIYRCAYGYSVHGGKHRRVCQYSGVWTGSDVECQEKSHYGYGYGKRHGY